MGRLLGGVDGFDDDEAKSECDEGSEVLARFLAAERQALEALQLTHKLLDTGASPIEGFVRARASRYRLSWNEANPGSCGLQDGQHRHTSPEMEQSAAIGGNVLMVAGARAEKVSQFVIRATEPGG